MERHIDINDFNYELPEERIAKFPLEERTSSKLLVYDNGNIGESRFCNVADYLPEGASLFRLLSARRKIGRTVSK